LNTFNFLVDQIPLGYAFNFENYLFNKIRHINTQGIKERADYFIINNIKRRIEGKIHFLCYDGIAYSPYKSLFGSFEFNPRLHPNLLTEFWEFIEKDLRKRKIRRVEITNFAECYAPQKALVIKKTLENAGFSVGLKAVNHHIQIDEEPLRKRMHLMEVRRLEKCQAGDFEFVEESPDNAEEIYDYLELCRQEQGLKLSVGKEKIQEYLFLFPQYYPIFSVRKDKKILAATFAIKIHRKIIYNFLPGSLKKYKNYSPTVMLNEGLYRYCQNHQIDMLDLGISTEKDGHNQKSLIAFKERIGGEQSYKYFFEKDL